MMNRLKFSAILLVGASVFCAGAFAQNAPEKKSQTQQQSKAAPVATTKSGVELDQRQVNSLERVTKFFNSTATLVGKFHQIGPDGSKTEGVFYMQRPGRVRFQYEEPSPIELVSDGSSIAVRNRTLATQDIYPLSQTPLRFCWQTKSTSCATATSRAFSGRSLRDDRDRREIADRRHASFAHAVRREGQPIEAVDDHRSAGLRHYCLGLRS
jgi:outer membrane lipoprotein-sorting protein